MLFSVLYCLKCLYEYVHMHGYSGLYVFVLLCACVRACVRARVRVSWRGPGGEMYISLSLPALPPPPPPPPDLTAFRGRKSRKRNILLSDVYQA